MEENKNEKDCKFCTEKETCEFYRWHGGSATFCTAYAPIETTTQKVPPAHEIIRMVLEISKGQWLAVHEITAKARNMGLYISDNAAASRLCIDLKGVAQGRTRQGKRFKEWSLI